MIYQGLLSEPAGLMGKWVTRYRHPCTYTWPHPWTIHLDTRPNDFQVLEALTTSAIVTLQPHT